MFQPPRIAGFPAYRLHKRSGRAVVTLPQPDGTRRDVQLGVYGSAESVNKWQRVLAEWSASREGGLPPPPSDSATVSITELIVRFWEEHVVTYYRHADGRPTTEQDNYRHALRSLRVLYGGTVANRFDPPMLEEWQKQVTRAERIVVDPITGQTRTLRGWSRSNANKNLSRIKALFKWGVRKKLVDANVYHALLCVPGLRAGRCDARETDPVRQVPEHYIESILPHVSRQVGAMAQLQALCGARPGELCQMRTGDIETGGDVWTFTPARHKNTFRGHQRQIPLGPRCQEILKPFLKPDLAAPIFSPAEAEAERRAKRTERRTTPLSCGNRPGTNRKDSPKRAAGDAYTVAAYRRAIERGCDLAFPPPPELTAPPDELMTPCQIQQRAAALKQWRKDHRWHPHQARHTAGTRARKQFGLQGAQAMLGHKHAKVTELYAEMNAELAAKVAREIG